MENAMDYHFKVYQRICENLYTYIETIKIGEQNQDQVITEPPATAGNN